MKRCLHFAPQVTVKEGNVAYLVVNISQGIKTIARAFDPFFKIIFISLGGFFASIIGCHMKYFVFYIA